jgi:hypothetical protein
MGRMTWLAAATCLLSAGAMAQQQQPVPQQQQQPVQQPSNTWAQLPRMQLERQFAGPLQDTIIQRWRDPADGTICYVYLPITAQHSPPGPTGFVQYGANTIGSISCLASGGGPAASAAPAQKKSAPRPNAPPNP